MKKYKWTILLFVAGLLILCLPYILQYMNDKLFIKQVEEFHDELLSLPEEDRVKIEREAKQCNEAIFRSDDPLYDPFTDEYKQYDIEACQDAPQSGEHFSSLEIPKLNLLVPIYIGATNQNLSKGVAQV